MFSFGHPAAKKNFMKLERVQKSFTRMLLGHEDCVLGRGLATGGRIDRGIKETFRLPLISAMNGGIWIKRKQRGLVQPGIMFCMDNVD